MTANTKQIGTLQKSKTLLTGNSKEAIANRKSLEDLTGAYKDQIEAYAAAGHTQSQVTAYANSLKTSFDAQAASLGYTKAQIAPYDTALTTLTATIKQVPTKTTVAVGTTGVDETAAALKAIPSGKNYTVTPNVNEIAKKNTVIELGKIPQKGDYTVTAKVSNPGAVKSALGGGVSVPVKLAVGAVPKLPAVTLDTILKIRDAEMDSMWTNLQKEINRKQNQSPLYIVGNFAAGPGGTGRVYTGGLIGSLGGGYAAGGLTPGTPPANPNVDNLTAVGPGGRIYGLRSREYVQPQPSVEYYGVGVMNALRDRRIPRDRMFYSGGSTGGHTGSGGASGGGWDGPVELSMADRLLLRQIRDAQPVVYVGDSAVAHSSARGAESNNRRGGS